MKRTFLGELVEPVIELEIWTRKGYRKFRFIVDTGADVTILPRYAADYIGVDLSTCDRGQSVRIEGAGIEVYISSIRVRVGQVELEIRCLFADSDCVPFILGRADVFDHFDLLFDNRNKRLRLELLSSGM